MPLSAFKIDSEHVENATWYEPVPTLAFRQLIRQLPIRFEDYVFIWLWIWQRDELSFWRPDYPFSKIIGIEIFTGTSCCRLRNIGTYTSSRQKVLSNRVPVRWRRRFWVAPEQTVLFFYSPFKAAIFVKVLDNVMSSLESLAAQCLLIILSGCFLKALRFLRIAV